MTEDADRNWDRTQTLRVAEELRLLVDSVVDYAIFLLDPNGVVRTWNPGAERMKGYRAEEIIGQRFVVFYPEEARHEGVPDRLLAEARTNGRTEVSGWRVRKDGTRFWADVVITALYDDDGVLHGFGKVTRDMTELHLAQRERDDALVREREAARRLQQVDEWRRDFVRSITHDIQSPVMALTGFASMIDDDTPPEARAELLDRVRANARSLQSMIDHLRAYVVIDSDQVALDVEPVALAPFVDDLVANLKPLLSRHEVQVDVPEQLVVRGDRQALERILRNVLGNAARHTPARGTVTVSARPSGDVVSIEVRDTGEGIAPDLLPRVLEKFHRGPGGRTGLGLAIAREYVELQGGTIEVRSVRGEGTSVHIDLPSAAA